MRMRSRNLLDSNLGGRGSLEPNVALKFPAIWELERYRPDLARLKKPTVLSTVFAVRIANGAAVFLIVALVTGAGSWTGTGVHTRERYGGTDRL